MPEHLILVEKAGYRKGLLDDLPVITAAEHLTEPACQQKRGLRIVNLCRSQKYLGEGYYCSLLAEARGHKVIPGVRTLRDLSRKSLYSLETEDIDRRVQKILGRRDRQIETTSFSVTVMFGHTSLRELQGLARELFELFRAPLMRVTFEKKTVWRITAIRALGIQDLAEEQDEAFREALAGYLSKRWRGPKQKRRGKYDLAILHNPDEVMPPSNRKALAHFIRAAREVDADLVVIGAHGATGLREILYGTTAEGGESTLPDQNRLAERCASRHLEEAPPVADSLDGLNDVFPRPAPMPCSSACASSGAQPQSLAISSLMLSLS